MARRSTAAAAAAAPPPPWGTLQTSTCQVFQDAQATAATHRRLIVVLKQLHRHAWDLGHENEFNMLFARLLNQVLPVKRGEPAADTIAKFLAAYIPLVQDDPRGQLFTTHLLRHLLRGLDLKLKNVRYRSVQLLTVVMLVVEEIEEDLYNVLVFALTQRLADKEPPVRVMAVRSISRLQGHDTDEIDAEHTDEAVAKVLSALETDPLPEVRRAALQNVVINRATLPAVLQRARDASPTVRRHVYTAVLKQLGGYQGLDFATRDKLLKWGLHDRDERVQLACVRALVRDWLDAVDGDVLRVAHRLHVVESPETSESALCAVFDHRADIVAKMTLSADGWKELTPELAFVARVFYAWCKRHGHASVIDREYPETTEIASFLEKYLELRGKMAGEEAAALAAADADTTTPHPDDSVQLEFVIEQLLRLCADYDFGDDFGRRALLRVLRHLLTNDKLTDVLAAVALRVLRRLSINERDFCAMTVEIITDIRDAPADEDEFHSAVEHSEDSAAVAPLAIPEDVWLQCLGIAQHLLELTLEPLRDNIALSTVLETLVQPAIVLRRPLLRTASIHCLGLCCLLDKTLAIENMYLFGLCATHGDEELRVTAVRTVIDILCIHGTLVLDNDAEGYVDHLLLAKMYYRLLRGTEFPDVQTATAEGLMKLYLADIMTDDDLFETLVLAYFGHANRLNQPLRQCLTFCIPAYAYLLPQHQERVARVSGDAFNRLLKEYRQVQRQCEEDGTRMDMATPLQMLQQLVDWTDPRRVVHQLQESVDALPLHALLAITLLEVVSVLSDLGVARAVFLQLGRLYITARASLTQVLRPLRRRLQRMAEDIDDELLAFDRLVLAMYEKFSERVDEMYNEARGEADVTMDTTVNTTVDESSATLNMTALEQEGTRSGIDSSDSDSSQDEVSATSRSSTRSARRARRPSTLTPDASLLEGDTSLFPELLLRPPVVVADKAGQMDPSNAVLAEIQEELDRMDE